MDAHLYLRNAGPGWPGGREHDGVGGTQHHVGGVNAHEAGRCKCKFEWSAVVGLTYNFINPYTQYQSGIDAHMDWAVSPYVSDKMHFGAIGYFYNQLTGDGGPGAVLGEHKSRVAGIGPQIGFFFPFMDQQGYLNVRGYREFDANARLEGWTAFITFSVEPPEQKSRKPLKKQ